MPLGHPWGTLATVRGLLGSPQSQNPGFIGILRLWRLSGLWEILISGILNAQVIGSNPIAGSRIP